MNGRLLLFSCHEAWIYQLRSLRQPLDIITDLPGRHLRGWDKQLRPPPPQSRLLSLAQARESPLPYDAIIAHSLSDLLDARTLRGPRLLILHLTLDAAMLEPNSRTTPANLKTAVADYVHHTGTHVVAISPLISCSWGFADQIVPLAADSADYPPWQGDLARGLRVSNFVLRDAHSLLWDFHQRAFAEVPVALVGHNPEIPGVCASRSWNELKEILRRHRFFIHTAHPQLEDGCDMATLEAMAAGLPILGNVHPSSPVEHGVSGFLSDDPAQLAAYAGLLLADRALARKMGRAAQIRAAEKFSLEAFRCGMHQAIGKAQLKWQEARMAAVG